MKRLLNEILELSRLESGRLELMPSKNNVKEAIETFLEKYAGFIEEKGLEIKVDLEPVMGYFDLIRFEQLLANYISNAGKYCDQNKRVEITAKSMTDKIRVTVTNSGGPI
jgi:signal transduction histidine kinase